MSVIENEAFVMPDVFGNIGRGLISSRASVALRSLNAAEKESRPSQGSPSQGGIAQEGHGAETPQWNVSRLAILAVLIEINAARHALGAWR
ncbi:hypothetical protein M2322_004717 [Rhodoblastus acidophilus]|uniref:hypothetical protein n=1 Tax=Rhodoblastus acidophilus TaxID=1074 RepID=UPI0022249E45|nr:hypothetical protein [Rhodoblastus acidophilus]MCW2319148.1 hypothetical protein [Rhodoblastus acidophilus]